MEKLIMKYVNDVNKWLITKNISSINCGWTDDKSVYYKMNVGLYTIYLEMFFDNKDRTDLEDGVEPVLNIFSNKVCIFSYSGTLRDCLDNIHNQINL